MNKVFVYGSNMRLKQMFVRCPDAKLLGPALLRNYRIRFAGASSRWNGAVATIVQSPGKRCYGLLFELTARDLERLDQYEGVPHVYERMTVPVHRNSHVHRAFVYKQKESAPVRPPNNVYFGVIWDAYQRWGFDGQGLAEAIEECCPEDGDATRDIALQIIAAYRVAS